MALGEGAHHGGLAARPEGGAGFGGLLDGDQPVDDLAALHQQPVHGLVDAVDLGTQRAEVGGRGVSHGGGPIRVAPRRCMAPVSLASGACLESRPQKG